MYHGKIYLPPGKWRKGKHTIQPANNNNCFQFSSYIYYEQKNINIQFIFLLAMPPVFAFCPLLLLKDLQILELSHSSLILGYLLLFICGKICFSQSFHNAIVNNLWVFIKCWGENIFLLLSFSTLSLIWNGVVEWYCVNVLL